MESNELFIPGKLLITGEYVILDGACGYALRTKHGQYISVETSAPGAVEWEAIDHEGRIWLSFQFVIGSGEMKFSKGSDPEGNLTKLLLFLRSRGKVREHDGLRIKTRLTFPKEWGLGSSSTVVAGLARIFDLNPYELLAHSFGGSGFDVAVGYENSGLYFERSKDPMNPRTELFNWDPPFAGHLFFVYLNEKRNSREAMAHYQQYKDVSTCSITDMSELTRAIISTGDEEEFAMLIRTHEKIISKVLDQPRIKDERFYDYPGEVKSLGGWGGDFCMAVGPLNSADYFRARGYPVLLNFSQITGKE